MFLRQTMRSNKASLCTTVPFAGFPTLNFHLNSLPLWISQLSLFLSPPGARPPVIRQQFHLFLIPSQRYVSSSDAHLLAISPSLVTFSFFRIHRSASYLTSSLTERRPAFRHNNLTLQIALVRVPTTRQHDLRSQRAHSSVFLQQLFIKTARGLL